MQRRPYYSFGENDENPFGIVVVADDWGTNTDGEKAADLVVGRLNKLSDEQLDTLTDAQANNIVDEVLGGIFADYHKRPTTGHALFISKKSWFEKGGDFA